MKKMKNWQQMWKNYGKISEWKFWNEQKKKRIRRKISAKRKEFRRLFSEFDATKAEIKNALELKETLAEKRQNLQKLQVRYSTAMANGSWSMANGSWSMANGSWSMANGSWSMANGSWSMANGSWSMAKGPWLMVHGPWSMATGPWPKVHGQRSMVHGPGSGRLIMIIILAFEFNPDANATEIQRTRIVRCSAARWDFICVGGEANPCRI